MYEKRIWWTRPGMIDQYGKQVYIGRCLYENKQISWSESYDAPTCEHPECRMNPWDEVEYI